MVVYCMPCMEITVVQGTTEIKVFPVSQRAAVDGHLGLQVDLDTQQGPILLGLALYLYPGPGHL